MTISLHDEDTPENRSDRGGSEARPRLGSWSRPRLTVECEPGDITTELFGEIPGGTRLHVRYQGGKVTAFDDAGVVTGTGRVLSGIDWVLLRRDAVAVFDTRLTFRIDDEGDPLVFDGVLSGLLDLAPAGTPPERRELTYRAWREIDRALEVALPVRFEASGPKQEWVAKQYQVSARSFRTYSYLASNQFLAFGTMDMKKDGAISALRLEIAILYPRWGA